MRKATLFMICFLGLVINTYAQSLGGGYQNTKWGMTVQEVKNILASNSSLRFSREANYSGGDRVLEYFSEQFKIMLFFYNNRLYYVEYNPFLESSDGSTANILLNELKAKYGNGRTYTTIIGLNLPPGYDVTEWNDGETIIRFRIGWFEYQGRKFNSYSYINVLYHSIAIDNEKNSTKIQRENEQKRRANENLRGGL